MSSGSHHHRRLPRRQEQIEWRRTKILEIMSKGESNQSEIARILQIDRSIVSRDLAYFRQQAKEAFKTYLDERLPEEYEKCFTGLKSILKEAWNIDSQSEDKRERIQALSLAKECYAMMLDLVSSAPVVERAARFVETRRSQPLAHTSQNSNVRIDVTADRSLNKRSNDITESR
jgi:Bacterial regulatory protein, arsR family